MYSHLFPSGQVLGPTTSDQTYQNIYNKLKRAKKSRTADLVKLSESLQFLECTSTAVLQKELECLTNIGDKIQQVIHGALNFPPRSYKEYEFGYLFQYTEEDCRWIAEVCWRLTEVLEKAHSTFERELVEEGLKSFHREVETLGRSLQRRNDNLLDEIKRAVEETQKRLKTGQKVKKDGGQQQQSEELDARMQRVCGNFDTVDRMSQNALLKRIQSTKESLERAVTRAVDKFEGSTNRAVHCFWGEMNTVILLSPKQRQQKEDNTINEVIQVQIAKPRTANDWTKRRNIVHSVKGVAQVIDKLKGKNPLILIDLTNLNNCWMSALQKQEDEKLNCVLLLFAVFLGSIIMILVFNLPVEFLTYINELSGKYI